MATGGLQRNSVGWTVDFSEVMRVTDSLGNVNFTYRVNHPNVSENIFYNLVHTETKGYSTVKLLRYHMHPEFAVEYYRGSKNISDFTGMIKVTPLTHTRDPLPEPTEPEPIDPNEPPKPPQEPCEEETIIVVEPVNTDPSQPYVPGPISGSAGGYASGSGGTPGDMQFFYEFSQIQMPDGPSCWEWVLTDCEYNAGHYGNNPQCDGKKGKQGSTVLRNNCTSTDYILYRNGSGDAGTINDPCELIGQIGVLSPYSTYRNHSKNCEKLKALTDDTKIKNTYLQLQNMAGDDREYGYLFEDDMNNPEELQLANGSTDMLEVPTGEGIYGASHTHPYQFAQNPKGDAMPMFSLSDIYKLAQLCNDYVAPPGHPPRDISKFVLTLTIKEQGSNYQTYALKIDNWPVFRSWAIQFSEMTKIERKRKGLKLADKYTDVKTKQNGGENNYMKAMFNFLQEQSINGISLYKANNNFSEWEKQTYNSSTKQMASSVPCQN